MQLARAGVKAVILVAVMDALLFGAAGRVDWSGPWILTALYLPFLLAVLTWATRHSPGLLEERSRVAANVKPWDKVIAVLYGVLVVVLLLVGAIDAGRLHWSRVPVAAQAAGCAAAIVAGFVIWTAMRANAYLSRFARIQDDRGHTVVSTGPYRYVRHPMYAAIVVLMFGIALLLASWWALVPAAAIGITYVVRTALEDRMLRGELAGYEDYARRVRYRLVPGIW